METVHLFDEASISKLRDTILKNTSYLVFRRVGKVMAKPEDLVDTRWEIPRETKVYHKGEVLPPFTEQETLQFVQERYSTFYFFTTTTALRSNDKWGDIAIYGASNCYSELDVYGASFLFPPRSQSQIPPRPSVRGANGKVMRQGDLICGLVSKPAPGRQNPRFTRWFICSEQFFHAWTAIVHPENQSLGKFSADEDDVRRYLMSGNRLATNGYRKWLLSCQQSNVSSDDDELRKRFYLLRTERVSKEWVHVYAALVLILRYKELPGDHNVPNNLDNGPKMTTWDLPSGWLAKVTTSYGLVSTATERSSEKPTAKVSIPKGTHISILIDHGEPERTQQPFDTQDRVQFPELLKFPKNPPPTPSSSPVTS